MSREYKLKIYVSLPNVLIGRYVQSKCKKVTFSYHKRWKLTDKICNIVFKFVEYNELAFTSNS